MKNKKEASTISMVKSYIRGETYFSFLRTLFRFSIVSLLFEIFLSQSVAATLISLVEKSTFIRKYLAWVLRLIPKNVPAILRASVVLEIVKILGFGSVLIGVIQALMDKKTFGVPYAKIIKHSYPYYQETFMIHLLVTIMCIGFSAAGASEGALVTLMAMLFGFLYLWIIIDDLVFHTANRESAAIQILNDSVSNPKNKIMNVVQGIAREANKEGNLDNPKFVRFFSEAMLKCGSNNVNDGFGNTARDISSLWETALGPKTELEQLRYATRIISECCKINNIDDTDLVVLVSGLILYLFNRINSGLGNEQISSFEDFFIKLSNLIYSINNSLSENLGDKSESAISTSNRILMVQQYMRTVYTVLVWTKVEEGTLRITTDMLSLEVDPTLSEFYPVLLETICATMTLTTSKDYTEKKDLINYVSNKLGLLP